MRSYRVALMVGGAAAMVIAAISAALAERRYAYRIPGGWQREMRFIGTVATPDSATGTFPEHDTPNIYERSWHDVGDTGAHRVMLRASYVIRDPVTRAVTYDYSTTDLVDRRTGRIAATDSVIAVFPRRTQPVTYVYSSNYVRDLPLRFVGEDTIDLLPVYEFAYRGAIEYSASYPDVPLLPGQEIRCVDDAFHIRVWVEPVMGQIVKIDEACPTGDYVVDARNGARVAPIMRWAGNVEGDALIEMVTRSRAELARHRRAARDAPLALGVAGALLLLTAFVIGRRARR